MHLRDLSAQKSRSILVTFLVLVAFAAPMPLQAADQQSLLTVTSDAFEGEYRLSINIDEGVAVSLTGREVAIRRTQTHPISELSRGIVLFADSGRDVVVLRADHFDPRAGGALELSHLVNGVNGKYRTVDVTIENTPKGWRFLADDSAGRRVVQDAFFKANRLFGRVVGIETIVWKANTPSAYLD